MILTPTVMDVAIDAAMDDSPDWAVRRFHQLEPASEVKRVQCENDIGGSHQAECILGGGVTWRIDVQRGLSRGTGPGPQFADHSRTADFGQADPPGPSV